MFSVSDMRLLRKGAEAELWLVEYLGEKALVKSRVVKNYRREELDKDIRKTRTKHECVLLHRAKEAGVRTPVIYKIDKAGSAIVMEFVDGERLKDVLETGNSEICKSVGKEIGKLHSAGLVHGDLTTSNILLKDEKLVFVDFGLGFISEKVEDKAVDLLVFKKTFLATHYAVERGWERVVEGYCEAYDKGKRIIAEIPKIEARARYVH